MVCTSGDNERGLLVPSCHCLAPRGGGVFLPSHNKIYDTHTNSAAKLKCEVFEDVTFHLRKKVTLYGLAVIDRCVYWHSKHLVFLLARVRPSVQTELDLHTADK